MRGLPTSVRELLVERDFRVLLGAQLLAQAADGIAQAGFAEVLLLEPLNEGDPARIFRLFALTLIPYSIVAPFIGVFVDRWKRRNLLVATNVLRAAMLVTLPLWAPVIPGDSGLFAAVVLLLGLGRLFLTTKGAVLPAVLKERRLLRGNAISGGGGMIAALTGGVVGIGIVGVVGPNAAFVLAGTVYAAAAGIAALISLVTTHPHAPSERFRQALARVSGELVEGARAVWARAQARLPLISIFVLRTVGMFVVIAAILVIKDAFPDSGDRFGRLSVSALALGTAGAGAFIGAVSAPALGRRFEKSGLVLLGFIVSGIGLIVLGGVVDLPAILGLTFVGGFGGFVTKVAVDAEVQAALPDIYRGRAFSLYDILYNLASVVAAGLMFALSAIALPVLLVMAGIVTLALGVLIRAAMGRSGMLSTEAYAPPA